MVAVTVSAPVRAQQPTNDHKGAAAQRFVKVLNQQLLVQLLGLGATAETCVVKDQPICPIKIDRIEVNGKAYCVAIAPNVEVERDDSIFAPLLKQKLVWELFTTALDGKPLVFQEDAGIVITAETHAQVDRRGGLGDDVSGPLLKHRYFTKTKRNVAKAESGYLPVILWGTGLEVELCAAIDPKIVNKN